MIELSTMQVNQYNSIIETRRKVYQLALDLSFNTNISTYLALLVSEMLQVLLIEEKLVEVKFAFAKELGHYFLHIYLSCSEALYHRLQEDYFFQQGTFCTLTSQKSFILLKQKISLPSFKPDEAFLQAEKERLIQQSRGEMLQEIRQKNLELHKALRDLKASSDMIQSEKMRALGGMTAGVAHELNNPMMGILNFIQYAIKHTSEDDRRYRPLMDALHEVNRCQDIISNLLTFSRMKAEGDEEYSFIKPSILFERILQLLSYNIRSNDVRIIKNYAQNEPDIAIKENKMQQVILNLVMNAIDAMKQSETRELTLTTEIKEGHFVFSVTDTGHGMDEETQDKIFEPFFTTKQAGQGTGLGLAVSSSIIEEHDGKLMCQSKVGEGSCFTVMIPQNK